MASLNVWSQGLAQVLSRVYVPKRLNIFQRGQYFNTIILDRNVILPLSKSYFIILIQVQGNIRKVNSVIFGWKQSIPFYQGLYHLSL